jgi:Fe-S cluster assembly protein SufD
VPDCRSYVSYRGALQGTNAHTIWVGDVLIRTEATGTDTYEVNRNLILTDGARADSIPNLEIETGEVVGAGHASATGRFDDEQLFYLMSRGIPENEARKLVVRGFFAELLAKVPVRSCTTGSARRSRPGSRRREPDMALTRRTNGSLGRRASPGTGRP